MSTVGGSTAGAPETQVAAVNSTVNAEKHEAAIETQEQPGCVSKALTWISDTFKDIGEGIVKGCKWFISLITCGNYCNGENSEAESDAEKTAKKTNEAATTASNTNIEAKANKEPTPATATDKA